VSEGGRAAGGSRGRRWMVHPAVTDDDCRALCPAAAAHMSTAATALLLLLCPACPHARTRARARKHPRTDAHTESESTGAMCADELLECLPPATELYSERSLCCLQLFIDPGHAPLPAASDPLPRLAGWRLAGCMQRGRRAHARSRAASLVSRAGRCGGEGRDDAGDAGDGCWVSRGWRQYHHRVRIITVRNLD
jgi:hypothetical protein